MKKERQQSLGPPPADLLGMQRWLTQLQELTETAHGQRGTGKRAFVERQDLVGLNLADWGKSGLGPGVTQNVTLVTKVVNSDDAAVNGEVEDATPPTAVRRVVAIGDENVTANVMVMWDITGIEKYGGANVYRSDVDDFGKSVKVGSAGAGQRIYVDEGVNSAGSHFYWVRTLKTTNTMEGPLNQVAGTKAVFSEEEQQQALADAALAGYRMMVGLAADEIIAGDALIGSLIVSGSMQSDDYVPGSRGWRLGK